MSFCPKCGARYRASNERPGSNCPLDGAALEAEGKSADPKDRKDPLLGRMIGGYTVVSPLADGETSRLFVARGEDGAERVLKVLDGDLCKDRELAVRYATAASLAELRDPEFFVRVFTSGTTEEGLVYIVMEKVTGKTLEDRLSAGSMFDAEGADVAAGVAESLATLHSRARAYGALQARKILLEVDAETSLIRVRLLDASAARARLDPLSHQVGPEDDMRALGALIRRMVDGTPGIPILALAARMENPEQDKAITHAEAFLAALNKKGSGVELSRPPMPAGVEGRAASERPVRAPSRRPSSIVAPPVVSAGHGRLIAAVVAVAVIVLIFWLVARREGGSVSAESTSASPTAAARLPAKASAATASPVITQEITPPTDVPPGPPDASSSGTSESDPAAAIDALFVELDAKLGDALSARGLGFEDLSAVEANRTRKWGRWFKKTDRPTTQALESTYADLLAAIDRAAAAKKARMKPKPAVPKKAPIAPSGTSTRAR